MRFQRHHQNPIEKKQMVSPEASNSQCNPQGNQGINNSNTLNNYKCFFNEIICRNYNYNYQSESISIYILTSSIQIISIIMRITSKYD